MTYRWPRLERKHNTTTFLFEITATGMNYHGALQLSGEQVQLVLRPPSRTRSASVFLMGRLTRAFIGCTKPRCDRCSTCSPLRGLRWYEIEWEADLERMNPPWAAISPMKLRYVSTEQGSLWTTDWSTATKHWLIDDCSQLSMGVGDLLICLGRIPTVQHLDRPSLALAIDR